MSGQLLGFDPLTKIQTIYHELEDGAVMGVESVQDATDIVEANKIFMNDVDERAPWSDINRVGSIPLNIWFDLVRQGVANDETALRRWLDDPDNRAFRTRPGKLSK